MAVNQEISCNRCPEYCSIKCLNCKEETFTKEYKCLICNTNFDIIWGETVTCPICGSVSYE